MKTKFGIVGCGFLGNIVADAWKNGLLELEQAMEIFCTSLRLAALEQRMQ